MTESAATFGVRTNSIAERRPPSRIVTADRDMPQSAALAASVQVTTVGLGGSDVHLYNHGRISGVAAAAPVVLGHEASGLNVGVGEAVHAGRIQERIPLDPGVPYGRTMQRRPAWIAFASSAPTAHRNPHA